MKGSKEKVPRGRRGAHSRFTYSPGWVWFWPGLRPRSDAELSSAGTSVARFSNPAEDAPRGVCLLDAVRSLGGVSRLASRAVSRFMREFGEEESAPIALLDAEALGPAVEELCAWAIGARAITAAIETADSNAFLCNILFTP
jgi:hypothetical protein